MKSKSGPYISHELINRIQLVRRDIGNLLFHFTRMPSEKIVIRKGNLVSHVEKSARGVLEKILSEGKLLGSDRWMGAGHKCICFTEAPISELAALFSLVKIAASEDQRPRYEPYGIAVAKKWLYSKGGRPVIYDKKDAYDKLPDELKYRHVTYDPENKIDFTWEREWRIQAEELVLDPSQALVIVPDASTAFDIFYGHAEEKPDYDYSDGQTWVAGVYHEPKWMAVSLDLFGIEDSDSLKEGKADLPKELKLSGKTDSTKTEKEQKLKKPLNK